LGATAHRLIGVGIGHNLPQEARQSFARAVVDVDGFWSVRHSGPPARSANDEIAERDEIAKYRSQKSTFNFSVLPVVAGLHW